MRKLISLFLSCSVFAANTCVPTAGAITFPGVAANWSTCGGTTPQSTDSVNMTNATVLTISSPITLASCIENNAGAQLKFAAGSGLTCTSASACITVTQAVTSGAGAIDTTAAGVGTEVALADTSLTSGYVITNGANDTNISLPHTIIDAGVLGGSNIFSGSQGNTTLSVTNSHLLNGARGIYTGAVNNLTIANNFFDGGSGASIYLVGAGSSSCSITNNSELNNTDMSGSTLANFLVFQSYSFPCSVQGNVSQTGSGILHGFANFAGTNSATEDISYNIGYSLIEAQSVSIVSGITASAGTASFPTNIHHNVLAGYLYNYYAAATPYTHFSDNLCYMGQILANDPSCLSSRGNPTTQNSSTNDTFVFNPYVNGPLPTGNLMIFHFGNGAAMDSELAVTNDTLILPTDVSAAADGAIEIGDGNSFPVQPRSWVVGTVVVGARYSIVSSANGNVMSSNCAWGGGLCFNNTYGWGAATPYLQNGGETNWQSGATTHPASIYSDTSYNPFPFSLPSSPRFFPQVDGIIGGPGTSAHLFSQLALRWNGTNDARYTPANIYSLMRAATAPQDVRFATIGPGGGLMGATTPVNIMAAVLVP